MFGELRDIALPQAASEQLGRRDPSIGVGATRRRLAVSSCRAYG